MVQSFCPLKVEIIQFPDGFRRKLYLFGNKQKNMEKYAKE